jgi:hypothetical protein
VWQQLGFDQIDDMLFIVSDNDMREQLSTKISYFLSNVDVVDRREDFRHTITKGNSEIPYDLQTLLVCGF